MLVMLLAPRKVPAGEFSYLPEHPGKLSIPVTISSNIPEKLLSKSDATTFKSNLERLRTLLASQQVFSPPRGVEVSGYLRPADELPATSELPIPGYGIFQFYFLHEKSGKPERICCTTDEIAISINDPDRWVEPFGMAGFPTKPFYEPKRVGVMDGFTVYRAVNGDEIIVLSQSSSPPPWVPITREEYLNVLIRFSQKAADSNPLDTTSPDIVKRHKETLAGMSANERGMQARLLATKSLEPTLAPFGSDSGVPLVRANPAWFNPALPRTAFQLIMLRFKYTGNMGYDKTELTGYEDISPLRVWEALHTSNWAGIGTALTDE